MKFWNFQAKSEDTGELMLYGDIASSSWYGDEVTPKAFKADLDSLGSIKNLNIFINSGGGDVFASQAIHSMLVRHSANKTVYIDGLAASGASIIAMAGDKIVMPKNAMMMIHNSWTFTAGNKTDLRKMADSMELIDSTLVEVYAGRTGIDKDEIKSLLDAETWLTAEDAVAKGFADEIEKDKKLAAAYQGGFLMLNGQEIDPKRYAHMPVVDTVEHEQKPPNESGDDSRPVSDNQTQVFKAIREKILSTYEKE